MVRIRDSKDQSLFAFVRDELLLGDCIKGMSRFDPESIDLIVTSPPYPNRTDYIRHYQPASELLMEASGRDERIVRLERVAEPAARGDVPSHDLPLGARDQRLAARAERQEFAGGSGKRRRVGHGRVDGRAQADGGNDTCGDSHVRYSRGTFR